MAVALFLLGLYLVVMAFLAALEVTVVLGYILAIMALGIGIYMMAKRDGRILPLILGVVLACLSLEVLAFIILVQIPAHPVAEIKTQHSA